MLLYHAVPYTIQLHALPNGIHNTHSAHIYHSTQYTVVVMMDPVVVFRVRSITYTGGET